MNYDHNCSYYNHTTRHGGKNKVEYLKALFLHMWHRLCHDIGFQCQNQEVVEAFQIYVRQQVAAITIGKHVRGWLVKCQMQRRGLKTTPKDTEERMHNYAIIGQFISEGSIVTPHPPATLFSGMHDISFAGKFPGLWRASEQSVTSFIMRRPKKRYPRMWKALLITIISLWNTSFYMIPLKTSQECPVKIMWCGAIAWSKPIHYQTKACSEETLCMLQNHVFPH